METNLTVFAIGLFGFALGAILAFYNISINSWKFWVIVLLFMAAIEAVK